MISYYQVPHKKGFNKNQLLTIKQEHQLKDSIHNKQILLAKQIDMKNSNINDDTISILWTISSPLQVLVINLSQNFSFITDKSIDHLCQCSNIKFLRSLNLADNSITDQGIINLAKCNTMMSIQQLILYGNSDITSECLVVLAQSQVIKKLSVLDLHATSVCDQGISYFLKSSNSEKLTKLNLSMNWKRITDTTLSSISYSKYCKQLKQLNVQDCAITDEGIEEIADSENVLNLNNLILNNSIKQSNNQISDKGLNSIAYAKGLTHLKILQVRHTNISSKGLRALAASLNCQNIQLLRLSYCEKIDDQVILSLKSIIGYQSMRKVYLNNTEVSKENCQKLQQEFPQVNFVY